MSDEYKLTGIMLTVFAIFLVIMSVTCWGPGCRQARENEKILKLKQLEVCQQLGNCILIDSRTEHQ